MKKVQLLGEVTKVNVCGWTFTQESPSGKELAPFRELSHFSNEDFIHISFWDSSYTPIVSHTEMLFIHVLYLM
ncbi:hypothetical protein [Shimazuella kribbensis]|uniref:hypothetical protein n=1 Tax=Shimazuella kribbensis TaxID=139808 RepID=UPI00048CA4EC|nr:hypothetical protein [Shimazuella kribbensis]